MSLRQFSTKQSKPSDVSCMTCSPRRHSSRPAFSLAVSAALSEMMGVMLFMISWLITCSSLLHVSTSCPSRAGRVSSSVSSRHVPFCVVRRATCIHSVFCSRRLRSVTGRAMPGGLSLKASTTSLP